MGRIIERTFSGYRINWDNVPGGENIKLVLRDCRTGERQELEDVSYWMRQRLSVIFESVSKP